MPDVFLSYARRDSAEFVRRLTKALEAERIDVWVDLDDIPTASDWQEDLRDGVLQSDCFCFVVSPGAAASRFCLDELTDAEARNKRVIPLIHEPVAEAELPRLLQRLNWVPPTGRFEHDFDANLKRLADAIRIDLEATRAHTRWETAAAEWAAKDRDSSLLPRGSELREAGSWIAAQTGRDPAPTALQAEFVDAARRANERRRRIIFGATVVALAVAVTLGIVALLQRNEAREQRDLARSNELASAAQASLDVDPELSIILGKEAVETVDTPRAEQALAQGIANSLVRQRLVDPSDKGFGAASYSPDGRWMVTGGGGGVELWDAETGEVQRSLTPDPVHDVAFTPDSRHVVAAGTTGSLEVLDVTGGAPTKVATGSGSLYSVDVSPDGKRIAAAGTGGFAATYDLSGGDEVRYTGYASDDVNSIAFAPNSRVAVTAATDGSARLWNVSDGTQLAVIRSADESHVPGIPAPGSPYSDAEFSPDGHDLATANLDGTATLWALDQGPKPVPTAISTEADGYVTSVAFDSERGAVLTAGIQTAAAWNIETGAQVASYPGHAGYVNQISASPDGDQVITAGQDGSARIWSFDQVALSAKTPITTTDVDFDNTGDRIAFGGIPGVIDVSGGQVTQLPFKARVAVSALAFSPDGRRLALAGTDGIVRIVDSATGKPAGPTIDPPGDTVHEVDWSADGSRLMARNLTFNNGGVYVYDPASGDQVGAINGLIVAAALSPDGTKVAYFGEATRADLSVRVVRVDSGDTVATLVGHNSNVEAIAFDRAGDRIATGSDDASARIWDASTGEQLRRLDNDRRVIKHIAFSDDGSFVAVTGNGLAVFNAQTGRQLVFVPGYDAAIAFSPDNRLIAAVGPGDQTVSAVHCDVCVDDVDSLLALADQRITREPTAAERREYLEP